MQTLAVYHHPSLVARDFPFFVFRKETRLYVNEKIMLSDGKGKELGPAKVLRIERVSLWDKSTYNVPKVTDAEAKLSGFNNLGHLRRVFDDGQMKPIYKITVRRE